VAATLPSLLDDLDNLNCARRWRGPTRSGPVHCQCGRPRCRTSIGMAVSGRMASGPPTANRWRWIYPDVYRYTCAGGDPQFAAVGRILNPELAGAATRTRAAVLRGKSICYCSGSICGQPGGMAWPAAEFEALAEPS